MARLDGRGELSGGTSRQRIRTVASCLGARRRSVHAISPSVLRRKRARGKMVLSRPRQKWLRRSRAFEYGRAGKCQNRDARGRISRFLENNIAQRKLADLQ